MNFQIGLKPAEGTRLVWHSLADRRKWEPRLQAINEEWPRAERRSVELGIRPLTQQALAKGFAYEEVVQWARNHGLYVRPVRAVAYFEGFAHRYNQGDALYVTAISNNLDALDEPEKHLGYPACCQQFFARHFPSVIDPVWQWAGGRESVIAPVFSNPLLRYWNVRFAPHIPCSPDCAESITLGAKMRELMDSQVARWVDELLGGPVEWNCYRGAAIVLTPYFRLIVGSNPTSEPYVVRSNFGRRSPIGIG